MKFNIMPTEPLRLNGCTRFDGAVVSQPEPARPSIAMTCDTLRIPSSAQTRPKAWAHTNVASPAAVLGSTSSVGVKKMLQLGVLGALLGAVRGYACTGYNPSSDQYFQIAERNLTGVIHGWVSNCYEYTYACGTTCHTTSSGKGRSSTSCSTRYCHTVRTDVTPTSYVQNMATLVQGCGFNLVAQADVSEAQRIANALFERNHRVKISINHFNTSGTTDSAVACLHNLT